MGKKYEQGCRRISETEENFKMLYLGNRLSYRSHFLTQDQGHRDVFKNEIKFGGGLGALPKWRILRGRSPLDVRHVPNTEMKTYFSPKTAFKG